MFVAHFMRQQTYDPTGLEEGALKEYAHRLAAPGALAGGIGYFRAHWTDAEHNRQSAQTKLAMPILTIGGTASFGAHLGGQIKPLGESVRSVMIEACGHHLAEEKPERVTAELLGFFGSEKRG